jgi:hypothetical protein
MKRNSQEDPIWGLQGNVKIHLGPFQRNHPREPVFYGPLKEGKKYGGAREVGGQPVALGIYPAIWDWVYSSELCLRFRACFVLTNAVSTETQTS